MIFLLFFLLFPFSLCLPPQVALYEFKSSNATHIFNSVSAAGTGQIENCSNQKFSNASKQSLGNGFCGIELYGQSNCSVFIPESSLFHFPFGAFSAWINVFWSGEKAPLLMKKDFIELRLYREYVQVEFTVCVTQKPFCRHSADRASFYVTSYPFNVAFVQSATWVHVAASFGRQHATIFLNGTIVAQVPTNGTTLRAVDPRHYTPKDRAEHKYAMFLGAGDSLRGVAGWLSQVSVFSDELTQTDARQLYAAQKDQFALARFRQPSAAEIKHFARGFHAPRVDTQNERLFKAWDRATLRSASAKAALVGAWHHFDGDVRAQQALVELKRAKDVLRAVGTVHLMLDETLQFEEHSIRVHADGSQLSLMAGDGAGALYAVFALIRCTRTRTPCQVDAAKPSAKWRVINHWSFFRGQLSDAWMQSNLSDPFAFNEPSRAESVFSWRDIASNNTWRVEQWARLLALSGTNAICPTDVNFMHQNDALVPWHLPLVGQLSSLLFRFNIRLFWTANVKLLANQTAIQTLWRAVPQLAGLVVKVGSEQQPGSAAPHAINTLARNIAPFGGVLLLRAFVYSASGDSRITDAYDFFKPFDGKYDDNVILIGKYTPIDFQLHSIRNPLDGAMSQTRYGTEVLVNKNFAALFAKKWQELYAFDNGHGTGANRNIFEAVLGSTLSVGPLPSWSALPISQANFYAFGRMAFNMSLTAQQVHREWVSLTFGQNDIKLFNGMMKIIQLLLDGVATKSSIYHGYRSIWFKYTNDGSFNASPVGSMVVNSTHIGAQALKNNVLKRFAPSLAKQYLDLQNPLSQAILPLWKPLPWSHKLPNGLSLKQDLVNQSALSVSNAKQIVSIFRTIHQNMVQASNKFVADFYLASFLHTATRFQEQHQKILKAVSFLQ